ncbi:diphosphomevalonate decarboxylase [Cladochytrium tenue]|nr:diphosphomevalonate decarboxylase [Cladochytrium tenue]
MQLTVATSPLLQQRISDVVPSRMLAMESAIADRDFDAFAEHTMRDSNQFHAVCLDTFPPIFYLTDVSRAVIALITAYNDAAHRIDVAAGSSAPRRYRAAYTFDAGPNAVLYVLREDVAEVLRIVNNHIPPPASAVAGSLEFSDYFGRATDLVGSSTTDSSRIETLESMIKERGGLAARYLDTGSLRRVIYTQVGDGPRVLAREWNPAVSLFQEDGQPQAA